MDSSAADILAEFASQPSPANRNGSGSFQATKINDQAGNEPVKKPCLKPSKELEPLHYNPKYEPLNYNPNVRIHPTEMQRYLHNLIRSNDSGDNVSVSGLDKETSPTDAMNEPGALDNGMMFCGDVSQGNSSPSTSHRGSLSSTSNNKSSSKSSKQKKRSSPSAEKQENYKSVDVLKDTTLIARFLTQTECASFLRATPEAVSYHCSKGGGICNGLVIRPSHQHPSGAPLSYGLFEDAEKYRPKERPQLNKQSVQMLKDWLLSPEHVDNPYPNQSEMNMLMEKSGLDKMQLKHWFNNARKRILKPYLKEGEATKGSDQGGVKKRKLRKNSSEATSERSSQTPGSGSEKMPARSSGPNPFDDDAPAITAADERPRMMFDLGRNRSPIGANQSLFGIDNFGGANSGFDSFRGSAFGGGGLSSLDRLGGSDALFGSSAGGLSGMGFNNDVGGMMGSSSLLGSTRFGNDTSAFAAGMGGGAPASFFGDDQDLGSSVESTRSNAIFKQQVAAMAMNEANIAFQDTEEAFSRAKELYNRSSSERPEDEDPRVMEANAVAKRCQSVAMFKLKVSQRANEEAAKAYAKYQQVGGGMDLGFDGGGFSHL